MEMISIREMLDYVANIEGDGITLTKCGRNAARIILEQRVNWTPAHSAMLGRIENGESKLPMKLARLVNRTRLGDSIELAKRLTVKERKADRRRNRRNAAKARRVAA